MARPVRIALLAHEFLINTGANDFLKNIIRGLGLNPEVELIFLCPRANEKIEAAIPPAIKSGLSRIPYLKRLLRFGGHAAASVSELVIKSDPDEYAFYAEACSSMRFVTTEAAPHALAMVKEEHRIDLFMPSIHILPKTLPYITYWPDAQPKYFPEFFDDESQRVRDERIRGLLASGKPMIINSQAAKADMEKFYQADVEQVFDLPFAPIIELEKLIPRPELAQRYQLRRPYFLICNQFWIHKSQETVIEAAEIAKQRGMDVDFVFTGKLQEPRRPGYIESIHKLVRDLGVSDRVRFLGYVPKDDQIELMKQCIAVIQPTLFEGGPGGGAVYDAISVGVRSVVSDIPINYELPLGDGRVLLFKTKDAGDLFDKLQKISATPYERPSIEDLYQQSRKYTESLSRRLYEAVDCALAR
ncbi:glycosyltransferase [Mesorhizobium sp. 1B3]|uniref:glycosyltransferase n=1 Tax=Mesorhizobium sp. 1B3 TaxID=3243599 RepID=UPI003D9725AC